MLHQVWVFEVGASGVRPFVASILSVPIPSRRGTLDCQVQRPQDVGLRNVESLRFKTKLWGFWRTLEVCGALSPSHREGGQANLRDNL